jgi:hypothetical protein
MEEPEKCLGDAFATAREREERGFAKLGFKGVLSPLILAETRGPLDMSDENCLGSSKNFRNHPKNPISNRFWRRANRIYMCGTWTSFQNQIICATN